MLTGPERILDQREAGAVLGVWNRRRLAVK